jgi:hypothetical protein
MVRFYGSGDLEKFSWNTEDLRIGDYMTNKIKFPSAKFISKSKCSETKMTAVRMTK